MSCVQVAIANVMPKKANFDLRRDVAKKLEKLEKRTQRSMVELMREEEERRMKADQEERVGWRSESCIILYCAHE